MRKRGRPRTAELLMEAQLRHLGGLRAVVEELEGAGMSLAAVRSRLALLTGEWVSTSTLRRWTAEWAAGTAKEDQ